MGISAKLGIAAVVVAVAGAALFSADTTNAAMTVWAAIKERQAAMKSISKDWKVIQAFVKDGEGTAADVAAKAEAIAATSKQIPALFPKGSGRGDFSDKETRAEPKIWSDWAGFENAATVMVTQSTKLAELAKTGDAALIKEQAGQTGKLGCGGCHKAYRGAKAK